MPLMDQMVLFLLAVYTFKLVGKLELLTQNDINGSSWISCFLIRSFQITFAHGVDEIGYVLVLPTYLEQKSNSNRAPFRTDTDNRIAWSVCRRAVTPASTLFVWPKSAGCI